MATANHLPLLDHPSKQSSWSCKPIYIVLSLLAIIIFPTSLHLWNHHSDSLLESHTCRRAHDPVSCLALVTPLAARSTDEVDVLSQLLTNSISRIGDVIRLTKGVNDLRLKSALGDCIDLMDSSMDRIVDSISILSTKQLNVGNNLDDVKTWLSGVLTNHVTCMDGLNEHGFSISKLQLHSHLQDLIARASASLAILSNVEQQDGDMINAPLDGDMPSWIAPEDRMHLSAPPVKPDMVVAKDGSGKYKTLTEAVAAAPVKSKKRYVIYVKKGTYKENVKVFKNKTNLMIVGDGMDSTILTGSLNYVDGVKTFDTGTLIVEGDGFIGQDLWIQNTAGPEKEQAVALRNSADKSVINRCRIDAYQDTLYVHRDRQFYRDCTITGTVDFIFGNAVVVFQKCDIMPTKPLPKQKNMVTAQARTDINQNTGISIQDCKITATSDLKPVKESFPSYLGRPWKKYSRTVVMQSYIGSVIDPAGWYPWNGDFALDTLYYGEYMNRGPGAGTSERVTWPGYHVITEASVAYQFTVAAFLIQGENWLQSTGVAYTAGLIEAPNQITTSFIHPVLV